MLTDFHIISLSELGEKGRCLVYMKRFNIPARVKWFLLLFHRQYSGDVHSRCGSRAEQRTINSTRLCVRHERFQSLRQPCRLAEVSAT